MKKHQMAEYGSIESWDTELSSRDRRVWQKVADVVAAKVIKYYEQAKTKQQ